MSRKAAKKPYPEVDPQPDLPALEQRVLASWERDGTFQRSIDQCPAGDRGANEFVFYDGPPFANGLPHHGHLVTGYIKDIIPRYQTLRGRRVERRFGWGMRVFLSVHLLIIHVLTKISIALWAGSLLLTTLFGWNQMWVMIFISAFTVMYTMKGGLRAVVYADLIQGFWLILGGVLLTSVGLVSVGGWNELTARAPGGMIEMVKPLNHELPITGFWISNVLAGMFYWCMDQTTVQQIGRASGRERV